MGMAVALSTLLIYLPSLSGEFINYDDPLYVYNNPAIRILDWEFVKWAFTTSYLGWLMPLTWLSFAMDYQLWGLNPFGYHLTNIILHTINSGMVVLLADRFYGNRFTAPKCGGQKYLYHAVLFLAGFIWAVHPLNVESVSWVTERKNVLNGVFSFSSLLCYLRYAELGAVSGTRRVALRYYILSLLLLATGLLVKPVGVVVPAMLLLIDWYPLKRINRSSVYVVLVEKIPYLLLSLISVFLTLYTAASAKFMVPVNLFSVADRFIASGSAIFDYCVLFVFPVGIHVMYLLPYPLPSIFIAKLAAIVLFTAFCLYSARRRPWLIVVWCCFLLPLLPTLPFFIGGYHIICAHFVYLPLVAPCIAVAYGFGLLYQNILPSKHARLLVVSVAVALLVSCTVLTEILITSWRNPETLWSRVIELRPIGRAYYYRAEYYLQKGRYLAAADDLKISIQMGKSAGFPGVFNLQALRGDALNKAGRYEDAVEEFTAAIQVNPQPTYFYHRGVALQALGRGTEAEKDFLRADGENGPITSQSWD